MSEEKIIEYIKNGGKIFTVKVFDRYRDGGTGVICYGYQGEKCYIHQDNNTLHNEYPPTDDNLIKDELFKEYLLDRLEYFINSQKKQVERQQIWLQKLNLQ